MKLKRKNSEIQIPQIFYQIRINIFKKINTLQEKEKRLLIYQKITQRLELKEIQPENLLKRNSLRTKNMDLVNTMTNLRGKQEISLKLNRLNILQRNIMEKIVMVFNILNIMKIKFTKLKPNMCKCLNQLSKHINRCQIKMVNK